MVQRVEFGQITNLGNVADPVQAQDAATKNYVDGSRGAQQVVLTNLNNPITNNPAVGATSFTSAGDDTAIYPAGLRFQIGTGGSNQILTVVSASVSGGVTTVVFFPALTSAKTAGTDTYSVTFTSISSLEAGTGGIVFDNQAGNLTISGTPSVQYADILGAQITTILGAISAGSNLVTLPGDFRSIANGSIVGFFNNPNGYIRYTTSNIQFVGGQTTFTINPVATLEIPNNSGIALWTRQAYSDITPGTNITMSVASGTLTVNAAGGGTGGVSDVNIIEPSYRNVAKSTASGVVNFTITDNGQAPTSLFSGNLAVSSLLFSAPAANNPVSDGTGTIQFTLAPGLSIRGFTAASAVTVPNGSAFTSVILSDVASFFTDSTLWMSTISPTSGALTVAWIGNGSPIITPGTSANNITMTLAGGWSPAGSTGSSTATLTVGNGPPSFKNLTSPQLLPAIFGTPTNGQVVSYDATNTRAAWQTPVTTTPTQINNGGPGSYTIAGGAGATVTTTGQTLTISATGGGGGGIAQAAGYNDGVINTAYYNFAEGAQPNTPFDQNNEGTFWQGASGYSTDPRYIQATTSANPSRGWTYFGTQVGSAFSSASYGVQTFTIGLSGTATANANPNNIVVGPNFRKPNGWYDNGGNINVSVVVASGVATITYSIDAVTITQAANSGTVGAAGDAILMSGASAGDLNGYKQVVTASALSGRNQTITYATTAPDATYPAQLQYLVDQFPGYIRNGTTRATLLPQNPATPAFSTLVNGNRFFGGTFGTPFLYNNSVWLVGLTLSFGVTKATTTGQNVDFSNPVSIGGVQFSTLVIDDAVSSTQLTLRIPGTFSSAPTINLPTGTFIAVWSPGLYVAGDSFGTLGTTTGGFIRATLPANTYYQDSEFCVFPNGFRTPAATKGDGTPNTFAVHWDFFVSNVLNVTSLAFSNSATNNNNRHGINGINGGAVGGNVTLIEPSWRSVSYTTPNNAETITVVDNPQPSTYVFSGNTTPTVITFPNGLAAVSDGTATINFSVTDGTSITGFTPNVSRTLAAGVPNSDYLTNPATYSAWWDPTLWSGDIVGGGFVYTYRGVGSPIVSTGTITLVFSTTGWLPPEMPGNLTSVITQGGNTAPTFKQYGLAQVLPGGRTTDAGGAIRFSDGSGYVGFRAPSSVTTSFDFVLPTAPPAVTTALTSEPSGQLGFAPFLSLLPLDTVGWVNGGINYYSAQGTSTVSVNGTFTAMLAGLNLAGALTGFTNGSPVIGVTATGGSVTGFYNSAGPSITGLLVDRASGFVAGVSYSFLWRAGAQSQANILLDTTGSGSPMAINELGYDPNFLLSAVDSTNARRYTLRNNYPFIISDAATPVVQARIRTLSNELEIGALNASGTGSRNLNLSAFGSSGMVNIGKQGGAWVTQQSQASIVQLLGLNASGTTNFIITGAPLFLGVATTSDIRMGDYSLAGVLNGQGVQIIPNSGVIQPIATNGSLNARFTGTGSVTIGTSTQLVVSAASATTSGIRAATPIATTDVATLGAVQTAAEGITVIPGTNTTIAEANVAGTYTAGATIAGGSWTGTAPLTIAGYTPLVGDKVVFVAQTPSSPGNVGNGGFTITANPASGSWTATRATTPRTGNMYLAQRGTNAGAQWINSTQGTIGLSTPLVFAQFGLANTATSAQTLNQVLATGKTATAANTDSTIFGSDATTPLRLNSSTTGSTSLQWVGATGTGILSATAAGVIQVGATGAIAINLAAGSGSTPASVYSTNGPLSIGQGTQGLNLVSPTTVIGTAGTSTLTLSTASTGSLFTQSAGEFSWQASGYRFGTPATSNIFITTATTGSTFTQSAGNINLAAASTIFSTSSNPSLSIATPSTGPAITASSGNLTLALASGFALAVSAPSAVALNISPAAAGVTLGAVTTAAAGNLNLQASGTGVIRNLSDTTFGPLTGSPNLNLTTPASGPTLTATSGVLTLAVPSGQHVSIGAPSAAMFNINPFASGITLSVGTTAAAANLTLQAGGTGAIALASPLISGGGAGTAGQVLTSRGAGMSPSWQAAGGSATNIAIFSYTQNGDQNPSNANALLVFNTATTLANGTSFGAWNAAGTIFTFNTTGFYQVAYTMTCDTAQGDLSILFNGTRVAHGQGIGKRTVVGFGQITATSGQSVSIQTYTFGNATYAAFQTFITILKIA